MLLKMMLVYSPVAEMSLLVTCIVISVDDGLLRTSTGCAGPSSSLTLYVDWLKFTVVSITKLGSNGYLNGSKSIKGNVLAVRH